MISFDKTVFDKNRSMNLLDWKNFIKVFMISQNINLLLGSQQSLNLLKNQKHSI